jgi:hypothetical protein
MAQQPVARKQSRSRDKQQGTKSDHRQNGHDDQLAHYEEELADYLQERIKPGLNSGAIPLLARSIAKEIAHREPPPGLSEEDDAEDESGMESDDEPTGEVEDEPTDESEDQDDDESSVGSDEDDSADSEAQADFEADMHDLQSELGEDWILRFSVQGDDAWLTAEKDDGTQRVEAPTAAVLTEAVELLNERGGRSS